MGLPRGDGTRLIAALIFAFSTALGCASNPVDNGTPASPSADRADVVVADLSSPDLVHVAVGQTVGLKWPGGDRVWQIDHPPDELVLLTPREKLAAPGPAGWVWRAAKAGAAEIVLTARAPCASPPCVENPLRHTVRLVVR